jgi:shikimate dehydrogenase
VSGPFRQPIDASTRYCAVFGHPVKHSASPAMQNAGIAALGLNWRYLAFEVGPEHLREAILGAKRMGFVGVNLTVPHKLLALDMMDALDVSARIWGAVNTIRFEGRPAHGGWRPLHELDQDSPEEIRSHGFNTDADALVNALREDLKLELRGASVLLLGAGGAGRTAALRLAAEGVASLFLVNRTRPKAEALEVEIQKQFPAVHVRVDYPETDVDLLMNATSLGLQPGDASSLDEKQFSLKQTRAVYDMIYRPAETPLLRAAKAAGCRVANGIGMLLHQGAKALEIWSGRPAPFAAMRRALEQNVYGK